MYKTTSLSNLVSSLSENKTKYKPYNEKELIKMGLYVDLIEKYKFKPKNLEIERKLSYKSQNNTVKTDLDLVVLNKNNYPLILFFLSKKNNFQKNKTKNIKLLYELANSINKYQNSLKYLVYYTRWYNSENNPCKNFITINYTNHTSFKKWNESGKHNLGYIPSPVTKLK